METRRTPKSKDDFVKQLLLGSAIVCFIVAAIFLVWAIVSKIGYLEQKYNQYIEWLGELENRIAQIRNIVVIIVVILLMYLIKSTLPIYPISILCVATGMVLRPLEAFAVNMVGVTLLYTIRYVVGEKDGGGRVLTIIQRSRTVMDILQPGFSDSQNVVDEYNPDDDSTLNYLSAKTDIVRNPISGILILVALRLMPGFPINTVSQLYGSLDNYSYKMYILFSDIGVAPRIMLYIFIGRNVTNPFSSRFTVPIIFLFFLTGTTLITIRGVWELIDRRKNHK